MPTVIACPECNSKLRVPDGLAGQAVRCARCGTTFQAPESIPDESEHPVEWDLSPEPDPRPAAPPPPPAPDEDLASKLRLSLDDDLPLGVPPRPEAGREPPPVRRAALRDEHDDLRECPNCGRQVHREYVACPFCGQRLSPLTGARRSRRRRMDAQPHRGSMVLTFGILGIVMVFICVPFGTPVGLIFGIVAWVLGQGDLAKMNRGEMDPDGESSTRSGRICGIIATVLGLLVMLGCGSFWFVSLVGPGRPGW